MAFFVCLLLAYEKETQR